LTAIDKIKKFSIDARCGVPIIVIRIFIFVPYPAVGNEIEKAMEKIVRDLWTKKHTCDEYCGSLDRLPPKNRSSLSIKCADTDGLLRLTADNFFSGKSGDNLSFRY